MSKLITASICLDDLYEASKKGHTAISKSEKNGKTYASIRIYVNDNADQWGNNCSLLLNSAKDAPETERNEKHYIGKGKEWADRPAPKQPTQKTQQSDNDLPF